MAAAAAFSEESPCELMKDANDVSTSAGSYRTKSVVESRAAWPTAPALSPLSLSSGWSSASAGGKVWEEQGRRAKGKGGAGRGLGVRG